ncbi:MAG: DUF2066 domain-containing protein [Alphaproteobacteria bacterium]
MRNTDQADLGKDIGKWRRGGAVCLLALALILPWTGGAAFAGIFTITGVAVSAQAASAILAKTQAIAQGQLKAYDQLIAKLTQPEDAQLLPPPDEFGLQALISGFSLDNERTGPTQYLADLTVRFNPDAVELLLARAGIKLNVAQSSPVLIIPIIMGGRLDPNGQNGQSDQNEQNGQSGQNDQAPKIWSADNFWRPMWQGLGLDDRLVPVLLPLGDATDKQIDAAALIGADLDALTLMAERYGVDGALVATLRFDRDQALVIATLRGLGPGGAEISIDRQSDMVPGEDQKAARTAALALLDGLDAQWQIISQNVDPANQIQKVALQVPFEKLRDWVAIRSQLEVTQGVRGIDVGALAAGGASIELKYSGDFQQLLAALDGQGLAIYDTGSHWELRAR